MFRAHPAAQGMCDNLTKRPSSWQTSKNGDSPDKMVVQGLQESSRLRMMNSESSSWQTTMERSKLVSVKKNLELRKVLKPRFTTDFPGAVIRQGAGELTSCAHAEGALCSLIDTTNVVNKRCEANARGSGLARHLPGHVPGGRGIKMGDHVGTSMWICTKRPTVRNPEETRSPRRFCL